MHKRKVCVVTGSRAEYGLLRWVLDGIAKSPFLDLQLIATGMHLSPEFGLTVQEIEADGYQIDRKVEMLLSSDTAVGITKSMGLGMIGFADAFKELQPDLLLVLGDRYEIFVAAAAAMVALVPIAHLHGGELTEGAFDDAIRHSITKMSHFHFVAADEYKKRVIQLGEQPDKVFNVGGLGVDNIARLQLLTRSELEKSLGFKFFPTNLLITYHPVTLEKNTIGDQFHNLLEVLAGFRNTGLIFTMPNSDPSGRILLTQINEFCISNPNAKMFTSLGQLRYLSCIKYVDGVVGNSSSGLAEVPSFKKGTVNIGDRQRARLKAESIIDCDGSIACIKKAFDCLFSIEFKSSLYNVKNPYGKGGASKAIIRTLENISFNNLLKKTFYNIPFPEV